MKLEDWDRMVKAVVDGDQLDNADRLTFGVILTRLMADAGRYRWMRGNLPWCTAQFEFALDQALLKTDGANA